MSARVAIHAGARAHCNAPLPKEAPPEHVPFHGNDGLAWLVFRQLCGALGDRRMARISRGPFSEEDLRISTALAGRLSRLVVSLSPDASLTWMARRLLCQSH